jgi:hypothetical protein
MALKARKTNARRDRARRRTNIARAIDSTWSSLRTHLSGAVKRDGRDAIGNEEFEARCVREYAETIQTLSIELHELARRDFRSTHVALKRKIPTA